MRNLRETISAQSPQGEKLPALGIVLGAGESTGPNPLILVYDRGNRVYTPVVTEDTKELWRSVARNNGYLVTNKLGHMVIRHPLQVVNKKIRDLDIRKRPFQISGDSGFRLIRPDERLDYWKKRGITSQDLVYLWIMRSASSDV